MPKSPFIALETINGLVRNIEGQLSTDGWLGGIVVISGEKITDALNKCAREGYELFDTDVVGEKKIYRLKLKTK